MVSATPRISNATLSGMLRGGRFSLGNRIVLSFGVLFVLMVIMAVVSYYATLSKGAGLVWHYLWGTMLFVNVVYGGGYFSVDQWLKSKFGNEERA